MKKFFIFLFLLSSLHATGLDFLNQDIGARYGAMGGIGTVNSNDAFALYWNPANVKAVEKLQVGLSQGQWYQGDPHLFAGVIFPVKSWYVGVSVNYSQVEDIPVRKIPQIDPDGKTEWEDWYIGISLMKRFSDKLSAGITYKKIYQHIYNEESSGYGLDFGLNYQLSPKLNIAAAIKNMGSMNELDDVETELPLSYEIGGSMNQILQLGEGHLNAGIVGQFVQNAPDDVTMFKTGLEYEYQKMFFLRAGYISGNDLLNYSFGLGIKKGVFKFDYAWKNSDEAFDDVHLFSFHFLF